MRKKINILRAITKEYPFTLDGVEAVFDKVKSYDETIRIIEETLSNKRILEQVVYKMRKDM